MESPTRIPQTLSPCSSGRSRLSTDSNSPEFEFWRLQNPSLPQPDILSADELFSGGVILPFSLLPQPPPPYPEDRDPAPSAGLPDEDENSSEEARVVADAGPPTASKRWRDMFKKADKKREEGREGSEKTKKKEKRGQGGSGTAELNINIWPFSRSRSAGNGGSRPRAAAPARKVSSAPCSRSNSAGENKSRKWPSSPGRAGVHLGRNSPVWQVRRTSFGGSDPIPRGADKAVRNKDGGSDGTARRSQAATAGSGRGGGRTGGGGAKAARVLNLNVPMCIGYRQHLSCKGGDSSAIAVAVDTGSGAITGGGGGGGGGEAVAGGGSHNLFNLRSLFTKKVY